MKQESSPLKSLVIPAAVLPFLAPMAAFAAEGTGRVSPWKDFWCWKFGNYPSTLSLIIRKLSIGLRYRRWQTDLGRATPFIYHFPVVPPVVKPARDRWFLRWLREETSGLSEHYCSIVMVVHKRLLCMSIKSISNIAVQVIGIQIINKQLFARLQYIFVVTY